MGVYKRCPLFRAGHCGAGVAGDRAAGRRRPAAPASVGWRLRRLSDDAVEVAAGFELGQPLGDLLDRVVLESPARRR